MIAPSSLDEPGEVTVGLLFGPDVELASIENDLVGLGEVVLFARTIEELDDTPGTYWVMENGLLIGTVDSDGDIAFPLLESGDPLVAGQGPVTVDALRSAE